MEKIALRIKNKESGIIALSTILLLGAVIMETAIVGSLLVFAFNNINYGVRLSAGALAAAKAGLADATIKLIRDKNISVVPFYSLGVGDWIAKITVCRNSRTLADPCDTADSGKTEITSLGQAFNRSRRLRAIYNVSGVTGETTLIAVTELSS